MSNITNLQKELFKYQDIKYRDFQIKLVPNINSSDIIGIRTPDLKNITKEFSIKDDVKLFLNDLPHKYLEENLIHMFLISNIKDFDICVSELNKFLPYVNSWPVSDQSSPKIFKKNHQKLISIIKNWMKSPHLYTARYGIRILMNEFLDDDFNESYLKLVSEIKTNEYYLQMMIAWFFATALAKQYDKTIYYFENHILDANIHKKAIQKAIDSFRVTKEHKNYLRKLR